MWLYHSLLTASLLVGIQVVSSFSYYDKQYCNEHPYGCLFTFLWNRICGSGGVPAYTLIDALEAWSILFRVNLPASERLPS